MPPLSLALLGAPEARHGGRLLAFRTHKTLALLVYLAVAGGAPTRDRLTALFWPESDERHGRMMLRRTLAFLRQTLGDGATPNPHLLIGRDTLAVDFAAEFDLDLRQLEAATTARPGRPAELETLRAVAGLVRGDFLEGFSLGDAPEFDDWAGAQREYWHQRATQAFDRLSSGQTQIGDRPGALASLTRWLSLDPLAEAAYQRLMQLHLASGDRAAALESFRVAQATLAKELAVEPSAVLQALAERARSAAVPQPASRAPAPRHSPTLAEGPLVGRAEEFSRLIDAYHAARAGSAQCVILEGEAGIGKTRLASDFLGWAAAEGAQVLTGRALEAGGRLPYQPVVEALRASLARGAVRPPGLSDVWLGELAQLLPELREHDPRLPQPSANEAAAQSRLFEAVARWGGALAARAPLVMFIDDVQWADVGSLDLLLYAGRRWAEQGAALLLLFALRTDTLVVRSADNASAPAPAAWLAAMARDLRPVRLNLGLLQLQDTVRYLEALSGQVEVRSPLEVFAGWLLAETGGQPFFMVETLKALLQQDVLSLQPSPGGDWRLDLRGARRTELEKLLPPGVRELIRGRLAHLRPEAMSLLAAGAVLGRDIYFEELCAVAGMGEAAGLLAWDELLAAGLLAPAAGGGYRFAHDKIRDVTYTEAGETRRRIFHRRALESLEAGGAPAAELAHHALAAGQLDPAYRYSLAAGDDAMQLYAVRDGLLHYERARAAAENLKPPPGLGQLYRRLGRASEAAGDYAQARVAYQTGLDQARATRDAQLECVLLNRLATLAGVHNFESAEVSRFLQQAVQVAQASGDRLGLAETEWNQAHFAFYAGQLAPAREHGLRALALAQELGAQELVARSLNVLGYVELGANDWVAAEAYAVQAQPLNAALGDRAALADSLLQVANARLNTGRSRAGIETAREAGRINQEIENTWGRVLGAVHLAHGLGEVGAYDEALVVAEEGARLGRALGMHALLVFMLAGLGAVHRFRLELAAARAVHLEAQAVNRKFPTQPFAEPVAAELCADEALARNWDEAAAYARQALAARGRVQVPFFGLTLWLETEALVRAGDVEAARADVDRFGAVSAGNPRFRIPHLRALAVLALSDGQPDLALAQLRQAAALAEELALPGETWSALAALGELHRTRGEIALAQQADARALDIVHSVAANIADERLRSHFLRSEAVSRLSGLPTLSLATT